MAHDAKQLKTFKFLQKIAEGKQRYAADAWNPYNDVFSIFGVLYATNGIVLLSVEYPEFEHISDDGWKKVSGFLDEKGYLLKQPILSDVEFNMRERLFADQFVKQHHYDNEFKINPAVLNDGVYLFKVYGINPNVIMGDGGKLELVGHNKDVCIRALMMGVR